MSTEERNKEIVRRYWEEVWSKTGNRDGFFALMEPGPYAGIAPSGRHASMEGIVFHHLVDGHIVREGQLSAWDWLGFYLQLGAIPVPS